MASKPLVATAGLVALAGAGVIGYAPRLAPEVPVVAPQALATELDGKLREATTGLHERVSTLAMLPSLKDTVSTDAATARNQVPKERMVQAEPGETITLGQVPNVGEPSVLIVLPDGDEPTAALERNGARLTVDKDALHLTEVEPVVPSEAERAAELRGAIAIRRPVDLRAFTERLDAIGAVVRITGDGKTLVLGGRTVGVSEAFVPLTLEGSIASGDKITAAIPMKTSGPPLRPIGGGLVGLGVVLLGLGLRGARPKRAQPDAFAATQSGAAPSVVGIGTVLDGTYEITGLLGKGGMGTVWQAKHLRLPDKRVAVKVLSAEAAGHSSPELLARFHREAEVTSKLGHPNIVGVLDFNQLPSGSPYIVLEYLEGESLAQRLELGPVPLDEAIDWARQIGSALGAAHRAGIVHRDLKPDNVFLVSTESGAPLVKVLDFGISKMRGSVGVQTQESTVLGTPQYMSPEQANGKNSEVDARADVWALGAIVHEMLTGQPAFSGDTLTTLLVNVLVTPSPSLRSRVDVPEHVAVALERALEKDPADRWPDVQSFITALTGLRPSGATPIVTG